ncbi:MAG: ACT domain-containing protein [Spirochaetota bacterium]
MGVKQISIFLENKPGRLAEVTEILTEAGINMRALTLADTADFGVLRIIVNDNRRCMEVLQQNDYIAQETDVIAVEIPDRPGGLHDVLVLLDRSHVNIEYMYVFVEKKVDNAIVIFRVDEQERAQQVLEGEDIRVLTHREITSL